jgi:multidrug efflux system membrane fusion protein
VKLRSLLLALPLVPATAAGLALQFSHRPAPPPPLQSAAPPGVPVVSGVVRRQSVLIYLDGVGSVQAFNTVTVRARVDGQLDTVAFAEGQYVKAGDLLAQLDPRPFRAQLAQTQAAKLRDSVQLSKARRDLERLTSLAARDFATKQSVESQQALVAELAAALQGDQALVDNAAVQLGYTTIRSPINGYTGLRLVDQGNMVYAKDPNGLVVITQRQPVSVVFTLPQDVLEDVSREMGKRPLKVLVFKRDHTTQLNEATLDVVDSHIDEGSGTIRLKATAPNEQNRLWPGEFVNARLVLAVRPDAVTVPARVVQRGPGGTYAYVIKPDQTVELRSVKVGQVRDDIAIIDAGLAEGEHVVIDGQFKLRSGIRVDLDSATALPAANSGSS